MNAALTRRSVLGGGLVLAFALASPGRVLAQEGGESPAAPNAPPKTLPGSLDKAPFLDAWIRVAPDGAVTVFTGKAELGQGIKTALIQVAAEQLQCRLADVAIVTADTDRTADEGYTAGSHSMQDSGTAIMHAAAQMRELLIGLAAGRFGLDAQTLEALDGAVVAPDGRRLGFGDIAAAADQHVAAEAASRLRDPASYTVMGKPVGRIDIPAKVAGGPAYVQDLRLPGTVHARVVRPPSYGATLRSLDAAAVERMPGVLKLVRDGNYLAVVATREYQAIEAMRALERAATWDETATLPRQDTLFESFRKLPAKTIPVASSSAPGGAAAKTVQAEYRRPYQLHGSIGPSCAVALMQDGKLTVWGHAQGMFPLRQSIAEMLGLPNEAVRCIHTEGSGCYGHNGADDAAADAALIARAFPGRPVRVQWMREQEHVWEPNGSVMITSAKAGLGADGTIVGWDYTVRSNTHSTRPPGAGQLMPAWHLASPFRPAAPQPLPLPEGGGHRNIIPLYDLPGQRLAYEFVAEMPIRVSALRSLGAYFNVFSIESFMDELALAAGADQVEFRLRHMKDARARDVIQMAADRFGWTAGAARPAGHGRGFAFARYKNLAAYAAIAMDVEVEPDTGRVRVGRVVAAVDSGQAVNPDGIRNQMGGGIVQSLSWTLFEQASFDARRITSRDWSTYPVLRFGSVPDHVEVHIMDRPGQPFLGTGEAAQGPTGAALANAIADATGFRFRELPLNPDRIKAAVGA